MNNIKISLFLFLLVSLQSFGQTELSLQKAIEISLANNYSINIQRKQVDIKSTQNTWGNAGALPNISLAGSVVDNFSFADGDHSETQTLNTGLQLDWTLFRGFSAVIQKDKLEEYQRLSEGNMSIVVENTIVNVSLAYYQVLLNQKKVESTKQIMELSNDRYELEKKKKELGTSVTYDLLQAQNSYLQDKSNYLQQQANFNNSVRQLNYMMASELDLTYDFTEDFVADTNTYILGDLLNNVMQDNRQLQNQYMNLQLARLDIKSAKANYYPIINLSANSGYAWNKVDYSVAQMPTQETAGWTTGASLSLSYNIFDGGRRKQTQEIAALSEEISMIEVEDMKQDLENQLLQEYELYLVRIEMMNLAEENLKAAELNLKLSKEKFENGSINSFNYRDVQLLYLNSANNYYSSVYSLIQSHQALLRLSGGIVS